jgi:hypothetical protein
MSPAPLSRRRLPTASRLRALDANLAWTLLFTLSCVFAPPPLLAVLDAASHFGAAREMNMSYRLLASGAFVCALMLVGYVGQADATTRLMLNGASNLVILAEDEENAEVQNLLEPETDGGQPGGDSAMKPEQPMAGEEMKAKPEGDDEEMKEMKEEGK